MSLLTCSRSLLAGILLLVPASIAGDAEDRVSIPAGTFTMGRTKLTADDKTTMRPKVLLDDRPAHKVSISSFRLDKYEVTVGRFRAFVDAGMGAQTSPPPPPSLPRVENGSGLL